MSRTPFMQLYPADYLAKTMDLTTEQHGAYLLILMTMWQHDATLPNDPIKLARIARMTPAKFRPVWDEISRFFVVADGKISNSRLTKERKKALEKSASRAIAGRAGGQAKALKDNEARLANAMPMPQHLPDTRYQKEEEGTCVPSRAIVQKPTRFDEFWDCYPHRDGIKRKRKEAAAAYSKAIKAGASEQQIIDGARAACSDPSVKRGYARDPASWLNQEGWTDETQPTLTVINGGPRVQSPQHDRQAAASDALRHQLDVAGRMRRPSSPNCF